MGHPGLAAVGVDYVDFTDAIDLTSYTKHAMDRWLVAEREEPVSLGFLSLEVPDAFFEPLPEEELAAWEGPWRQRA